MTDELNQILARISALAEKATAGPWEQIADVVCTDRNDPVTNICTVHSYKIENATFIADARTSIPRLVAALRHVLETENQTAQECYVNPLGYEEWRDKRESELLAVLKGEKP